jgi:gliding motility-associated-like protein
LNIRPSYKDLLTALKNFLVLIFLSLTLQQASAQLEANQWFVNIETGLDFNCGSIKPLKTASHLVKYINPNSGSICDSTGNFLFYSDGVNVFDRNNNVMPGGRKALIPDTGFGDGNSLFIVPNPVRPNLYYLFFVKLYTRSPASGSLNYAIVDMQKNNGLGAVTLIKYNIEYPALDGLGSGRSAQGGFEDLYAIRARDRKSYWLLFDRFAYQGADSLILYHITGNGWNRTHFAIAGSRTGTLKIRISPNGKYMALIETVGSDTGRFYLYDFNNEAGIPGKMIRLKGSYDMEYIEFSPDGTKIYLAANDNSGMNFWQYDISGGLDSASIMKSATIIGSFTLDNAKEMKCGPDGRIYLANETSRYLTIIDSPNVAGKGCMFTNKAYTFPSSMGYLGGSLPHFVTRKPSIAPYYIRGYCQNQPTYFTPFHNVADGSKWDFGDPSSGAANYSSLRYPEHIYAKPGHYIVRLIADDGYGTPDTFAKSFCINPTPVKIGGDTLICKGDSVLWDAGDPGAKYLWNDGDTARMKKMGGNSQLIVSVSYGDCTVTDTFSTHLTDGKTLNLGKDTSLCEGDSLTLDAGYRRAVWSTNDTTRYLNVKKQGLYRATITNGKCSYSDSIQINVLPAPEVNLGGNRSFCALEKAQLDAGNTGAAHLWSTGDTGRIINVTTRGKYWVRVSRGHCTASDTAEITFEAAPEVNLGKDTGLCATDGEVITLDAGSAYTYDWLPGHQTGRTIEVRAPGTYTVKAYSLSGCLTEDSIHVSDNCSYTLWIPNACSPRNQFRIIGSGISSYSLRIYNRWGEIIYASSDMNSSWDGTFRGKACPEGIYIYQLEIVGREKGRTEHRYLSGNIELLE